jgi:CheY-like chemotaxis protein
MPTILIVDDDPGILEAAQIVLEDAGFNVIPKANGRETIDTLLNNQIDLVLLDVLLSGIDGRDIARSIKDHPQVSHTPIVLMSAHLDAQSDTKSVGAEAFLAKPFNIDDLIACARLYTNGIKTP